MTNLVIGYLTEVIISTLKEKRGALKEEIEEGREYIPLISLWS